MSKLIFLSECSPVYTDYKKAYSRLRFYADTLTKLAEGYSCDEIHVVSPRAIKLNGRGEYTSDDVARAESLPKEQLENCYYLECTARVPVSYLDLETYDQTTNEDVVLFGILNGTIKDMNNIMNMYYKVISSCKYYHYLSSDAELTTEQYILRGRTSFLTMLPDLDPIFNEKLKSVIITEVGDYDVLNNYQSVGISADRIKYLPMIVNCAERLTNKEYSEKNNRVMLLRGFEEWADTSKDVLEILKGRVDVYESSLPAVRKKLMPHITTYDFNYKTARFWTTERMCGILGNYSYYVGASSPRSSRFTYKLVESVNAHTVCILPNISLEPLGLQFTTSQSILDKYKDSIMVLNTPELLQKMISHSSDSSEYKNYLDTQKEFLLDYFDIDSDHINSLINDIVKEKV